MITMAGLAFSERGKMKTVVYVLLQVTVGLFGQASADQWGNPEDHLCPTESPIACYNKQCCKPNQFCGRVSEACEDCLIPEPKGKYWCGNHASINFRDPSCNATFYNMHKNDLCCPTPGEHLPLWTAPILVLAGLALGVGLTVVAMTKLNRYCKQRAGKSIQFELQSQREERGYNMPKDIKDGGNETEENKNEPNQDNGSINIHIKRMMHFNYNRLNEGELTSASTFASAPKIETAIPLTTDNFDVEANCGERVQLLHGAQSESDSVRQENQENRAETEFTETVAASCCGLKQTVGATDSNGGTINPVTTPADETGTSKYVYNN